MEKKRIPRSAFIKKVLQTPTSLFSLLNDIVNIMECDMIVYDEEGNFTEYDVTECDKGKEKDKIDKEENFNNLEKLSQGQEPDSSLLHKIANQGDLIWIVPTVEKKHLKELLTLTDSRGNSVLGTLAENHPESVMGILLAVNPADLKDLLLLRDSHSTSVFEILLEKQKEDLTRILTSIRQEDLPELLLLKDKTGRPVFETLLINQQQGIFNAVASQVGISVSPQKIIKTA